ncbi:ornithine cyclodeaminase family protein [Sphingobacterium mizutaii]|uniref:ornithine cyclodeaminase family protein n=1 Tax=Sphingobacterium mizutaii TaxID=1010 RepID=UPI00289C2FF8|nr:ornithine cyclodeaminase family protein [Sphingobacterium mizutaii]
MMRTIDNETIDQVLNYDKMLEALYKIFISKFTMPVRHHHFYNTPDSAENALILMPAWTDKYLGCKQVIVAPKNAEQHLPAIHALYTLFNAETGVPLAQMDATKLTSVRTACASALAAKYLARENAENLLVIGSGSVAYHLAQAHSSVRNYKHIEVWARNTDKAQALLDCLKEQGFTNVFLAKDLQTAIQKADVISSATLSKEPIIKGEWLKPGVHLDLIGSHTPKTREADDEVIRRSTIYADSREGALHETGELAIPIASGLLDPKDVQADLVELCKANKLARKNEEEITLFKSAGLAIEDLAAALMVYEAVAE